MNNRILQVTYSGNLMKALTDCGTLCKFKLNLEGNTEQAIPIYSKVDTPYYWDLAMQWAVDQCDEPVIATEWVERFITDNN